MIAMCSNGCDRLASLAPDSDGDLCGVCRDAEVALGREPTPDASVADVRRRHVAVMVGHVRFGIGGER